MKIVALSDLHGYLPDQVPACDLLLLAGDLCPIENHAHGFHAEWLDTAFRRWLERVPARQVIGVAGNHDLLFEQAPELAPAGLRWTYLQDSGTTWQDVKIWGTPWQPWFFDWAFNGRPEQLQTIWAKIPDDTDILVVHGPPHGYGDGIPSRRGMRHTGCPHLLERIQQVQPRLVVFGHIHEGRGEWTLGKTTLANVTILNEEYDPVYSPWSCDW